MNNIDIKNLISLISNNITNEFISNLSLIPQIIKKDTMSTEEKQIIDNFIGFLFNIDVILKNSLIKDNHNLDETKKRLITWQNKLNLLLNECYLEPITNNKKYTTDVLSAKYDSSLGSSNANAKGYKLTKKNPNYHGEYNDFPNIEDDKGIISGFANTFLIIGIVVILGVILSIISLNLFK